MDIVDFKTAKDQGLPFYFTGKPCHKGHLTHRRTSTRQCIDCEAEYRKQYYENHSKEYYQERYKQNKDQHLKNTKRWKMENDEYYKAQQREYYQQNKDVISEYHKKHYRDVVGEGRRAQYRQERLAQADLVKRYYQSVSIEQKEGNEAGFRNFVAWTIANELDLAILTEYRVSNQNEAGRLDIYLPELNAAVEVKLDVQVWTKRRIVSQKERYQRLLETEHVYVVSPAGSFEFTLDGLIQVLRTLQET